MFYVYVFNVFLNVIVLCILQEKKATKISMPSKGKVADKFCIWNVKSDVGIHFNLSFGYIVFNKLL